MARFSQVTDNILERYFKEELEFEIRHKALESKRATTTPILTQDVEGSFTRNPVFISETAKNFEKMRDNAFKRNKAFLKELEVVTAKLRSRTYFCPPELQLIKLKAKYEEVVGKFNRI